MIGMITFRRPRRGPTCKECRHFIDDPHQLERMLPGVLVLSSTYGSTMGDSGICTAFARLQDPEERCDVFDARPGRSREVADHVTSR